MKVSGATTTLENSSMISYRTNIHEINNQAILLLGTHLRDMKEEMYMKLFVGVLCIIAKNWK